MIEPTFMEWLSEMIEDEMEDEDNNVADVSYSAKKQAIKAKERVARQQALSKDPQERQLGRLNVQKTRIQDKQLQKNKVAASA